MLATPDKLLGKNLPERLKIHQEFDEKISGHKALQHEFIEKLPLAHSIIYILR